MSKPYDPRDWFWIVAIAFRDAKGGVYVYYPPPKDRRKGETNAEWIARGISLGVPPDATDVTIIDAEIPARFVREPKRPTHPLHLGYQTEPGETSTPILDAFFALPRNMH